MKVTDIQVFIIKEPKGKLRAYARALLDDQLQLTGLRIYDGQGGLFLSYPNDPNHTGDDYRQIFYPVTRELRDHLEFEAVKEYLTEVRPELFTCPLEDLLTIVVTEKDPTVLSIIKERLSA